MPRQCGSFRRIVGPAGAYFTRACETCGLTVQRKRRIMASEVRMKTSVKVCAAISVLLFVVAGLVWWCAQYQRHIFQLCVTPTLEMPIRFEEGFSFTSSFTTALTTTYDVEVVCRRTNPHENAFYGVGDKLPINFSLLRDGVTVAQGDSPDHRLGGGGSVVEDTWVLAIFKGQPGMSYQLSFRAVGALPSLAATKPVVWVRVPPYKSTGIGEGLFTLIILTCGVAVLGVLFALPACIFIARKLMRQESQEA